MPARSAIRLELAAAKPPSLISEMVALIRLSRVRRVFSAWRPSGSCGFFLGIAVEGWRFHEILHSCRAGDASRPPRTPGHGFGTCKHGGRCRLPRTIPSVNFRPNAANEDGGSDAVASRPLYSGGCDGPKSLAAVIRKGRGLYRHDAGFDAGASGSGFCRCG